MRRENFLKLIIVGWMAFFITSISFAASQSEWRPAGNKIMTRWGKQVTPENVWREYPRPQLQRTEWINLNGLWNYAITPIGETAVPQQFDGEILVPFCVESSLSGVGARFTPDKKLWYHTEFSIDPKWARKNILLHFGAVDWACEVWVNDKKVGEHKGGSDAFSFDITSSLKKSGTQKLIVAVTDPTSEGSQARGKQDLDNSKSIWYTPVSGIWQTVWMEPVTTTHIASVYPTSDIDKGTVTLTTQIAGKRGGERLLLTVYDNGKPIVSEEYSADTPITFNVPNMKLWSPENPHLYHFDLTLKSGRKELDKTKSYFAMRKISKVQDVGGKYRIALNNEIRFLYGYLDQGWWPDGLLTPPSAEAMRYDLEFAKESGANVLRKHIKVEPALYYYYADSLGMLLWQDMPSGFAWQEKAQAHVREDWKTDWIRPKESARQWEAELKAMLDNLRFFPSVAIWCVFNEGWGQYDTQRIVDWVSEYDPTRIIDGVSGFADRNVGDMRDLHHYPEVAMMPTEDFPGRILTLGEFGGYGLAVEDHIWMVSNKNWGYKNIDNYAILKSDYSRLIEDLQASISAGFAAAIYTQITDVEREVNGLMTYDREVIKIPLDELKKIHDQLYKITPAKEVVLVSDHRRGEGFKSISLNDAPAQRVKNPIKRVRLGTKITSVESFNVDYLPKTLCLHTHIEGDIQLFINGKFVEKFTDLRAKKLFRVINLSKHIKELHTGINEIKIINTCEKDRNGRPLTNTTATTWFDYSLTMY